ncbi:MAG: YwhD family protein [Alicyclobacillus sp.]|nr:YwhD family protein [Alicyclobacillus sp.]
MEKLSLTGSSKHGTDDALRGLSAVLVDGSNVFVDNGAIHGKSCVERDIRFVKTVDEVPNPRTIWAFWITLHRFEAGQGYYGAMPFRLLVDSDAKLGYKSLAEEVNGMEKAVKGQVETTGVPSAVVAQVGQFLRTIRPELWTNAAEAFRNAFGQDGNAGGLDG